MDGSKNTQGGSNVERNDSKPDPQQLESFQSDVTELFEDLCSAQADELLTIPWLLKAITALSLCLNRFTPILLETTLPVSEYPMKDIISVLVSRIGNALDFLNAVCHGISEITRWKNYWLDSAVSGLSKSEYGRAKRALTRLVSSDMLLLDHPASASRTADASKPWSASEQLQTMVKDIVRPSKRRIRLASGGFDIAVFTMSFVLFHVLWILVAAFPCQGRRSFNIRFKKSVLRGFEWGDPIARLHRRIMELDPTAGGRPGLRVIHDIERHARRIVSLIDSAPSDEQKQELEQAATELGLATDSLKEGLDSLDLQLSEIKQKLMKCLIEGQDMLPKSPLKLQWEETPRNSC